MHYCRAKRWYLYKKYPQGWYRKIIKPHLDCESRPSRFDGFAVHHTLKPSRLGGLWALHEVVCLAVALSSTETKRVCATSILLATPPLRGSCPGDFWGDDLCRSPYRHQAALLGVTRIAWLAFIEWVTTLVESGPSHDLSKKVLTIIHVLKYLSTPLR